MVIGDEAAAARGTAGKVYIDTAWRETLVFVIGGGVGLVMGNWLNSKISNSRYILIVTSMLCVAGATLSGLVNVFAVGLMVVVLLVWIFKFN